MSVVFEADQTIKEILKKLLTMAHGDAIVIMYSDSTKDVLTVFVSH